MIADEIEICFPRKGVLDGANLTGRSGKGETSQTFTLHETNIKSTWKWMETEDEC